jgi:hypothetical protein
MQKAASKMPGQWTFLLLTLCGVLLFAVVMPSMMVSQIEVTNTHHKVIVTLTSGHGRLTGSRIQLPGSSRSRRELTLGDAQQQPAAAAPSKTAEQGLTWQKFWGSELEHGECSCQCSRLWRGPHAALTGAQVTSLLGMCPAVLCQPMLRVAKLGSDSCVDGHQSKVSASIFTQQLRGGQSGGTASVCIRCSMLCKMQQ